MTAAPSDFDPARFIRAIGRAGHNGFLGTQPVAHGADWCELGLPWRAELVGEDGSEVLASGPIVSLMDMSMSIAIWLKTAQFRPTATIDLRIDYLRPALPHKMIVGRGECYKVTRRVAFVRGEAHDGDPLRPIAHVTGSYMFTDAA